VWRRIAARARARRLVRLRVARAAVLVAFLLLWECRELEDGAALGVGVHRVGVDEELADAVVS